MDRRLMSIPINQLAQWSNVPGVSCKDRALAQAGCAVLCFAVYARKRVTQWIGSVLLIFAAMGCHHWHLPPVKLPPILKPPPPVEVPLNNPAQIGPIAPDFLWQQIVDAVDDSFRISSEQRVRRDANNWMEGRLETYPDVGPTLLEPWRKDSTPGFERIQSTIQTIRRTTVVRVIPNPQGYLIDVKVTKEQEDVDQSQFATSSAAARTHSGAVIRTDTNVRGLPITLGWINIGRDMALERRLLESIVGRVTNVEKPTRKLLDFSR